MALAEELGFGREAAVQYGRDGPRAGPGARDHAVNTHGRIDVIINNAGLMPLAP